MKKYSDGHISSGSLHARGGSDARSIFFPVEGVVVAVHYPEDESNRSKSEMEYDIDVTSTSGLGRLRNVPRAYTEGGVDDGSEGVLTAANTTTDGSELVMDSSPGGKPLTHRFGTNGDVVLVTFVNGNIFTPVIIAVRQHPSRRRKALEKPDSDTLAFPSRRHAFRGNVVDMDGKGNVTIEIGKAPKSDGSEGEDKKKLTLKIGDFEIVLDNSNSPTKVTFGVPNGPAVEFTKDDFAVGASGTEPMVMGNALSTWLENFQSAFNNRTHACSGSVTVTVTALNSPATGTYTGSTSSPSSFSDALDVKSNYAKVSKDKP